MEQLATRFMDRIADEHPDGDRLRRCLQCGSCSGICPLGFAMEYPPHRLIAALRAADWDPILQDDSAWLCVSCFACTEACPAGIPLTEGLMAGLKSELLLKGKVPGELQTALGNTRRYGNPLGESPRKRAAWTKDFTLPVPLMAKQQGPVEVLWYVGDYPSYHPRVQQVSRSMARLFHSLNVSFGILGPEEQSDGDAQNLAGERGLFQLLAAKNAKAIQKYLFDVVVTTDPHAYNAFRHEYPHLGIEFPVQHYTQFLQERLAQLQPLFRHEMDVRVTYHDPCYLGRAGKSHVYEQPRQLLQAIPGVELVEMPHQRQNSLCCGGGGGGMWLDGFAWEKSQVRSSEWRIEEALSVGAEILAVACPYETPRFEDAVKSTGNEGRLQVRDIAELLVEAINPD